MEWALPGGTSEKSRSVAELKVDYRSGEEERER